MQNRRRLPYDSINPKGIQTMDRRNTDWRSSPQAIFKREEFSSYRNLEIVIRIAIRELRKKKYRQVTAHSIVKEVSKWYEDPPPAWLVRRFLREPKFHLINDGWSNNVRTN